ncbi:unnamed protein product [Ectocarpus sp. 4 AP-2014]
MPLEEAVQPHQQGALEVGKRCRGLVVMEARRTLPRQLRPLPPLLLLRRRWLTRGAGGALEGSLLQVNAKILLSPLFSVESGFARVCSLLEVYKGLVHRGRESCLSAYSSTNTFVENKPVCNTCSKRVCVSTLGVFTVLITSIRRSLLHVS